MPQLDFDGANSRLSADNIRGQSGSTITIVSGHNLVGSGSGLTALNATNLASGTVPTARLGSGTANNGVFLRGDGTWAAAGGGVDGIVSSADATAITIDANEKVGIVTTTPNSYEAEASQLVVGTTSGNNGITIASGTSNVGSIYFADGTVGSGKYVGYITYTHSTNRFSFGANAATKLALDSDGLKFGTDTAAANALNDYEEGTWTPAWIPTSGGWSGTFNGARYVKIGKLVWAAFTFTASAQATGTKMNGISGLPFTSANEGVRAVPSIALSKVGLADHQLHCRVAVNNTTIDMGMSDEGTSAGGEFTPSHTSAQSQFSLTLTYKAAS